MEYQSIFDEILDHELSMQYDLLFLREPEPAFCLCLHPRVFLNLSLVEARRLSNKVQGFGFKELRGDFEPYFGSFGVAGVFKGDIALASWPPLAFTVPLAKFSGEPGIACRLAFSVTLNLAFSKINYPNEIFHSARVQCLSLEISCGRNSASGCFKLTGHFSPVMRKWLEDNIASYISEVEEAMQMVWRTSSDNDSPGISAMDQGEHGFLLNVPGSAASMVFRPYDILSRPRNGLIGHSNNIDCVTTQLVLLAGIGTLCRLHREAGNH
jgi:hypothetical protein